MSASIAVADVPRIMDRFPDDVLLQVFDALVEPPQPAESTLRDTFEAESDPWLPVFVSWVCRNWRGLALSSPQLWRSIAVVAFKSSSMLQAFLDRSAGYTLRILFNGPFPDQTRLFSFARLLSNHSHRFVSFHLHHITNNNAAVDNLVSCFTSSAPQLCSLRIQPTEEAWVLRIFNNDMPLLKDLVMFATFSDLHLQKGLTRLTISLEWLQEADLIAVLRSCPALKMLDINYRDMDPTVPSSTIALSYLEVLNIDSIGGDAPFLRYLSFPRTIAFSLSSFPYMHSVTDLKDSTSVQDIVSLVDAATVELSSSGAMTQQITIRARCFSIQVYAYGPYDEREWTGFSLTPFPALQQLTISGTACELAEHHWRCAFLYIPTVARLRFSGCGHNTMVTVLQAISRDAEPIVWPALESIMLDEFGLPTIIEQLESCLRSRAAAGFPLASCELALRDPERVVEPAHLARLNDTGVPIILRAESESYNSWPLQSPTFL